MNKLSLSYCVRFLSILLLLTGIVSHSGARAATLAVTIAKTKGITCRGNTDGVFKATPTGGTAPYTYLWSNGDTGQSTTSGLAPGTYTCTVKDAVGGSVTSSGLAIAAPQLITITASTQTNVTIAGGSDGTATATTVTGGTPPYTYNWVSSTSVVPAGNGTNQARYFAGGDLYRLVFLA
jgi:hypothetical protein